MTSDFAGALASTRPDLSPLKHLDIDVFRRETPPIGRAGKIASWATAIVIVFVVLPELVLAFGPQFAAAEWIVSLGLAVPAIVAVAVLCLIRVDKKPVLNFGQALVKVEWGVVLFIAATMLVASAFSNPDTGLQQWMGYFFAPIFGGMSPIAIIAIACVGVIVVSQFMPNGLTMTVFWTIGSPLLLAYSGTDHLAAFGLAICIAAGMAVLTGPATLMTALVFEPGHITIPNSWKANLSFLAMSILAVLAFIPVITWVIPAGG